MNCAIFGHHVAGEEVKPLLKEAILYLVQDKHIRNFLVGNNGNFDFYAQCVLQELKPEGVNINFSIVLSHIEESSLSKNQNETIFPEELENAIPRLAIFKRNEWIIKKSSFLIAYAKNKFSNSHKWIDRARKKGVQIINIADRSV